MAIDPAIKRRIFRNALLSLFIYSLPVVALFFYLKVTGERPWEDKTTQGYFKQIDKYKEKSKDN
jgi:hypothetical protein